MGENNVENSINSNMQNNFGENVTNNTQTNVVNNTGNNPGYNPGYNPNNMGTPKRKKTGLIVLWIILGIIALAAVGIGIAIIVKNVTHDNEIKPYKSKVEQYLSQKYNEEFDVKYIEDKNAEVKAPCGNTSISCGKNSNVIEYYFDAKSKNTNKELSVCLTERKDTGKQKIEEHSK